MKLAIVTGANSEIGITIIKKLLSLNYFVIGCIHKNNERIKKIENANLKIKKIDLTNEEEIIQLLENKKVDVIVNVAAYYYDDYYYEVTKEDFIKALEVNVVAPFLLFKYANMNNGKIINISSTDGIDTYNELNIPYSASKAALNNLTQSLAYLKEKAEVYAIALGWVNTEMIRAINQDYLKIEMERANQKDLIPLEKVAEIVENILNSKYENGSIIRIDGE